MNIAALVDRGLEIREKVARLSAELKDIETKLKAAGLKACAAGRVEDLKDADREGRVWPAGGTQKIVPLVFTADLIIGSFAHSSEAHKRITEAPGGGQFLEFFKPVRKFENKFDDGKKFRAHAREILGPHAPGFITACVARDKAGVPKSDIKIMWSDAEGKVAA